MTRTKSYEIHDNGARPFLVTDHPDDKFVIINMTNDVGEYLNDGWGFQDLKMQYTKIFAGSDVNHGCTGNTVLLEIGHRTYYCIQGRSPFFFKTMDDIIEYHSPIGNSDVPYPYAIGTDYVYLVEDQCYTSRDTFPNRMPSDPYVVYYDQHVADLWKPFPDFQKMCSTERECLLSVPNLQKRVGELESTIETLKLEMEHLKCMPTGVDFETAQRSFNELVRSFADTIPKREST